MEAIIKQRLQYLKKTYMNPKVFSEQEKAWINNAITLLGLPKEYIDLYYEILSYSHLKVIWLHMEECSGCSESILMSSDVGFERFVIDFMQIQYHDMLMANSGHQTKQTLKESIGHDPYVLIVEGSVSEDGDMFLTLGAEAYSGAHECKELAQNAKFVVAVGSCSSFGGIQVAYPNPTKAKLLSEIIHRQTINIAGCPPSDTNICNTLLYLAITGTTPPLDELNRPLWSYGKSVHDLCERKGAFLAGEFVEEFGDEGSKLGYCLYKVGCRGPYVYNNCARVKFNSKISWPIQAGHGCIGCSEPNFWDNMGRFETPMGNHVPKLKEDKTYLPKLAHYIIIPKIQTLEEFEIYCQANSLNHALLIRLDYEAPTHLYTFCNGISKQIDNFSFEANLRVLFDTLATKTKIGGKLAKNYFKAFLGKETFIKTLSQESKMSANLCDMFSVICTLVGEDKIYSNIELVKIAEKFIHHYASKYTMKFKMDSEEKYNVDFSKFLSPVLSYVVGGLDSYGVCYGVLDSYAESFGEIMNAYEHIVLSGDVFASIENKPNLFAQKFLQYGRTKKFYLALRE